MTTLFNLFTAIILSLFLVGCEQQTSDEYLSLLQHPDVLQRKMAECRDKDTPDCKRVKDAALEYMSLNTQRQSNPELFGKMVLQAEEELGVLKEKLQGAEKNDLNHSDAQGQKSIVAARDAYRIQEAKVNKLLAIVAATSPE